MKVKINVKKKTNSKPQNFEKKNSHQFFFRRSFRIIQKSLVQSLILPIIFGQVWIGEIENKMPKMLKK